MDVDAREDILSSSKKCLADHHSRLLKTPRHLAQSCMSSSGRIHASGSPITNLRLGILQLNGRRAARLGGGAVCLDVRGATKGEFKPSMVRWGSRRKRSATFPERPCSTAVESVCCILIPAPCTVKFNPVAGRDGKRMGCAPRKADSAIDNLSPQVSVPSVTLETTDQSSCLCFLIAGAGEAKSVFPDRPRRSLSKFAAYIP